MHRALIVLVFLFCAPALAQQQKLDALNEEIEDRKNRQAELQAAAEQFVESHLRRSVDKPEGD